MKSSIELPWRVPVLSSRRKKKEGSGMATCHPTVCPP
ncbi:hypothetical protein A2U01_0081292, partial [Trifolium medium]|nr:hypothetical protein [Trifolium medium]